MQPAKFAEEGDAPQVEQNGALVTPDDINALRQAILDGTDLTQAFEASAAGGAPAADGGGIAGASGNGGFVTIDRTGSATIAEATFDTTYNVNGEPPLGAVGAGDDEVFDLTLPSISVVAPDNTNDTTPTLSGTTDAPVGSTVTLLVTDANGNQQTLTAIVTPGGTFTVNVVTPLAEGTYTVTTTVTDSAGNTGSATDSGSVDVTTPVITVDAPDNTNDTTPTITGTTNVVPGSTVTLVVTDANGNLQTLTTTVQPDGSYSIGVTTPLAEGGYQVTASVTDLAGNTGTFRDDGNVDITLNIKVILNDVTADNVINAAESGQSIPVSGRVTGEFKVGDVVTLTVNGQEYTTTLNAAGEYSVNVAGSDLAADTTIDAKVAATDAAGNVGEASVVHTYGVDTAVSASITLDGDITADDVINAAESGQDIAVTGQVGGDVQVGDIVTLTVNGKAFTGTVAADKSFSIDVPGSDLVADGDKVIDASVTTTDAAGNSTTATDTESYRVDTTAPDNSTTSIIVNGVTADNVINAAESGQSIPVSGRVTGEFKVGDVVT
ncbi:retention module-containing protein, partial [Aeromonas veronii]|uniref:retention module-containing protein n=1 Tax=Aeromonas veronii TaxID=654 RepID=UPI003F681428